MSIVYATPQANKENTTDDKAHVGAGVGTGIVTPCSIPDNSTSTSSASTLAKQRVVFSKRNKEHYFDPVLPANPTPSSDQEPSKSILKKRCYDEFLADDSQLTSLIAQRSSTPEPDTEEGLSSYLLSPVTTLVQSVQGDYGNGINNQDIIEAYCVLSARIRAKFLPVVLNGATATTTTMTDDGPEQPRVLLHMAMEPVQEYIEHLVCAITRDVSRALEDPLKTVEGMQAVDTSSGSGDDTDAASSLPSPASSSPSPFDAVTGRRSGMNEQQVKHARDLCTVAQTAMKLLATLFCFTEAIQAGQLFSGTSFSTFV